MIFRNAFYEDGELYWFDQEWILDDVPAKYVLCSAMWETYLSYPWMEGIIPIQTLADKYGFLSIWEKLVNLKHLFSRTVMDEYHTAESELVRGGAV